MIGVVCAAVILAASHTAVALVSYCRGARDQREADVRLARFTSDRCDELSQRRMENARRRHPASN